MTTHHAFKGICMKSALMRKILKVNNGLKNLPFSLNNGIFLQLLSSTIFPTFLLSFPTGSDLLQVVAYDRDQRGTLNSTFHYEIKHVSPNTADTEFFIDESGIISFKGCLDHEAGIFFHVRITVGCTVYIIDGCNSCIYCSARSQIRECKTCHVVFWQISYVQHSCFEQCLIICKVCFTWPKMSCRVRLRI